MRAVSSIGDGEILGRSGGGGEGHRPGPRGGFACLSNWLRFSVRAGASVSARPAIAAADAPPEAR
eukprot:scaffold35912_cov84-Isochrysis_galbana.AAC.1